MKSVISVVFFISVVTAICSCQNGSNRNSTKAFSYPETIIPSDTTKLWLTEGDPEKNIVAIFLQGGPKDQLNFKERGRSSWRYLPDYKDYYCIHLHQSNTLNIDMFVYEDKFTMDMAREEVMNSSEILYRAIKYFKVRGKEVIVFGHSYGAFIIPHYLASRPSLADKYVIVSGRIDDPLDVVKTHENGFNGSYTDGRKFESDEDIEDFFTEDSELAIKYYTAKQVLKAAIGEPRYSKELKDIDLKNSIYVYNAKDKRVGGLTDEELQFLKLKGMQIHETDYEHGETIYGLVDAIEEGKLNLYD